MKLLILLIILTTNAFSITKEDLVGKYAHFDIVAYEGELWGPIKLKSNIISFGITEYLIKDDKLISRDRFCFSDYKANLPFSSKTSDEFTKAIIPKDVELELLVTNGKLKIYRPETPTLVGVELNSYKDNFPSDPADPRFVDSDKDGKPGVTVKLSMGKFLQEELYIARKEIFSYDAVVRENGIIAGVVRDRSQQYIISASDPKLVTDQNPLQVMDLSKSPIYLIPLKEDMDCDELKAKRDQYFPKNYKKHKRFYKKYE